MPSPRFLLLAPACLLSLYAPASARAESLAAAVGTAIANHPSVTAAQANRDALDETVNEQRSNYFPQFSTEAVGGRIYGDNATSRGLSVTRGAGYSGYGEGSVNLTQRLFDGFETGNRTGAAKARFQSADYAINDVREDLALRATLAYLDVRRGQESLDRLNAYGKTLDDYIARIDKAVKEGGADATLSQQAQDIKAQLDNTVAGIQGQLQNATATYTELIGHGPESTLEKPVPPLALIPATAPDAVAYAHDHHPTLKAAALTAEAAGLDSKAERAAYYPTLNGQLSYLKSDEKDLLGGELIDARAVVKMDWNYALGGAEQARVRRAQHESAQSRAQVEDLQRQIARRIEIAYSDDKTAQAQSAIQQQRVTLNESLFNTQKQQFEGGKVNLLQLLQSDNSLFNARLSLLNNDYKQLSAKYAILASLGRLNEALATASSPSPLSSSLSPREREGVRGLSPSSQQQPPAPPGSPLIPAAGAISANPDTAPPAKSTAGAAPATTPLTAPIAPPPVTPSLSSETAPLIHAPAQPIPDNDNSQLAAPLESQPAETQHPALAPISPHDNAR